MLQIRTFQTELPFQYPFTITKGTKTHQKALVVALGFGPFLGWGEAPEISYYPETVASMNESLKQSLAVTSRYSLIDPQRFWHFLHHQFPEQHFLIAALDIAGWDLYAQLKRKPLYELLELANPGKLPCDYTLGIDTPELMVEKLKAHPAPVYKVKLARPADIDLLRRLRAVTNKPFRVDVNEGWNYEDTLKLLPELQALGVVLLEQPLAKSQWEEMIELKAQSAIPLFADEACVEEEDVARCAAAFHGINIKLTKCGGITPALRMIAAARQLQMKVMLGSMNESVIGTAALAHLAPLADYLDLDGPLLLTQANAKGLSYDADGFVSLGTSPGIGVQVVPTFLKPFS